MKRTMLGFVPSVLICVLNLFITTVLGDVITRLPVFNENSVGRLMWVGGAMFAVLLCYMLWNEDGPAAKQLLLCFGCVHEKVALKFDKFQNRY